MKNLLQQIEEKWKLLFLVVLTILVYTIYASIKVDAELAKAHKELAKEKYQKNLIEALYLQRQEFIDDKEDIDEMISNLEKSKLKKDQEIFYTESLIRCEKVNNNRLRGEIHDDCKANWRNYPKK